MTLADDVKLTGQLMTCSKEVFRTLIDLNEKVNAEFGAKPFTRLAFEQMLVAMSVYLAEMFPESHIPAITGTYCIDTGVVDLPSLLPVIEKLVADKGNTAVRDAENKVHRVGLSEYEAALAQAQPIGNTDDLDRLFERMIAEAEAAAKKAVDSAP